MLNELHDLLKFNALIELNRFKTGIQIVICIFKQTKRKGHKTMNTFKEYIINQTPFIFEELTEYSESKEAMLLSIIIHSLLIMALV